MYGMNSYIRNIGRRGMLLLALMIFFTGFSIAQADRKFIRQGNREYEKKNFPNSEIYYRKATDKNKESADAVFNTGDALYRQEKYAEAGNQFAQTHSMNEDKDRRSASLYNLGNSLLMAGKIEESIEAYKNSLRLDPDNREAKYNLAYAQDLLRQQQQQQQQQGNNNQDQNKDQKNDKENKDQQQEQEQANQDQQENQQQQDQQDERSISKEDAERLLNALASDEKDVQEKVKKAKAARTQVRVLKNW